MSIPQITSSNTFAQWLAATQSLINKQNYLEDSSNTLLLAANTTVNLASNTANVYSNTVNVYNNTVNTYNALVTFSNTANQAYEFSNIALSQANAAYNVANSATSNIFSALAFNHANASYDHANAAFIKANNAVSNVNTFISIVANGTYVNATSNASILTLVPGPNLTMSAFGTTITINSLGAGGGGSGDTGANPNTLAQRDTNADLYANNFISTSDVRLKENIRTIDGALEIVKQLRGVRFSWKNTSSEQIGLIAQEVETVLPSIVYGDDMKSVNYVVLTAVLIEAVKELSNRLDNLEK